MSAAVEFLFFDCMDTLIQMDIPSMEIYPDWAYQGARSSGLWESASKFRKDWVRHRETFITLHGSFREYTILGRIRDMIEQRLEANKHSWSRQEINVEATKIHEVFWRYYRDASHVLPEVPETLEKLRSEFSIPLGVASNFMVPGGIPELLTLHQISTYFSKVVVSCDYGWRKPAEFMYEVVIRAAGCEPGAILFIGDNPLADYEGPRLLGMQSLLYDPANVHPEVESRFRSFEEILTILRSSR